MPEEVPLPEGVRPLLEEGSVALLVPPDVPVLPLFMSVLRRAGSAAVRLRPVLVPAFGAGALRVVLLSVRLGVPASTGGVAVDPVVPDGAVPEVCATAMPPASDTQVAAIVANRKYVLLMLFLQKTLMTRLPPRRRSANTVLSMGNACAREVSPLRASRPGEVAQRPFAFLLVVGRERHARRANVRTTSESLPRSPVVKCPFSHLDQPVDT